MSIALNASSSISLIKFFILNLPLLRGSDYILSSKLLLGARVRFIAWLAHPLVSERSHYLLAFMCFAADCPRGVSSNSPNPFYGISPMVCRTKKIPIQPYIIYCCTPMCSTMVANHCPPFKRTALCFHKDQTISYPTT